MNLHDLMTVDVEDWYQGVPAIPASEWPAYETRARVVPSTERLLGLLAEHRITATFFVVGRLGETHPELIRRIAGAGHEIAAHGYSHTFVHRQTREEFRQDLRRTVGILSELANAPVHGYRAPYFSIDDRCRWALDILIEEGIVYDASLFPLRTPLYGTRTPDTIGPVRTPSGAQLLEVPVATDRFLGIRMPITGGIYTRFLPWWLTARGVRHLHAAGRPIVYFVHPWEFDPSPPAKRRGITLLERIVHHTFLGRAEPRLRRLLQIASFTSIRDGLNLSDADGNPV